MKDSQACSLFPANPRIKSISNKNQISILILIKKMKIKINLKAYCPYLWRHFLLLKSK